MPVPHYEDKHSGRPYVTPHQLLSYRASEGRLIETPPAAVPDAVIGPSWTTDAPYRETAEEISAYRAEGILTVDMEASAIFTVGALLGVQTASIFCISDVLHGEEWEPHSQSPSLADALWGLFEAIESMLLSNGTPPITSNVSASNRRSGAGPSKDKTRCRVPFRSRASRSSALGQASEPGAALRDASRLGGRHACCHRDRGEGSRVPAGGSPGRPCRHIGHRRPPTCGDPPKNGANCRLPPAPNGGVGVVRTGNGPQVRACPNGMTSFDDGGGPAREGISKVPRGGTPSRRSGAGD